MTLLPWLALPLLAVPFLARRERVPGTAGQLLFAGFGLAALRQGAGTLDLTDLKSIAMQSPHDAWFVGLTAGAIIAGGCIHGDRRNRIANLPALPLAAAMLYVALSAPGPLLLGGLMGALPRIAGRLLIPANARREEPPARLASKHVTRSALLAVIALVSAAWLPLVLSLVAMLLLAASEWQRDQHRPLPLRPLVATALCAAWAWLAVTVAGDPFIGFFAFAHDAPVSEAAGRGLALLAAGWSMVLAAPWPIDRGQRSVLILPVTVVVAHLALAHATADGTIHWQPVMSTVLVVSGLVAVGLGRVNAAAAALALIAGTRHGAVAFIAAAALSLVPMLANLVPGASRIGALGAGVLGGSVIAVLLRDQVLLAVLLAIGLSALANRRDRVAPLPDRGHL